MPCLLVSPGTSLFGETLAVIDVVSPACLGPGRAAATMRVAAAAAAAIRPTRMDCIL